MAFLRHNDLKNDDAAILIVKVEQDGEYAISYKDILLTDINEHIKKQHGNSI